MRLIKRKTRLNTTTFASKIELDSLKTIVHDLKANVESELHSIRAQLGSIFRVLNEVQNNTKKRKRIINTSSSSSTSKKPNLGYYSMSPTQRTRPRPNMTVQQQNYYQYQLAMQNQARTYGYNRPGMNCWTQGQGQVQHQQSTISSLRRQNCLGSNSEESRTRKRNKTANNIESTTNSDSSQLNPRSDDRFFNR